MSRLPQSGAGTQWLVPVVGALTLLIGAFMAIGGTRLLMLGGGTQDYYLRALDGRTGKELWKARLPVGSQAGPMTYVSPDIGRQYVVVTAGGARTSPDRGDYVIAYALPQGRTDGAPD